MSIKPKPEKTQLAIEVERDLKNRVQVKAKKERVTLRQIVEDAFKKYLSESED